MVKTKMLLTEFLIGGEHAKAGIKLIFLTAQRVENFVRKNSFGPRWGRLCRYHAQSWCPWASGVWGVKTSLHHEVRITLIALVLLIAVVNKFPSFLSWLGRFLDDLLWGPSAFGLWSFYFMYLKKQGGGNQIECYIKINIKHGFYNLLNNHKTCTFIKVN